MPEGASSRLLLPVGAAVALAAAAAVWVVPLDFLRPQSITGAETGAPPFPPFQRNKPAVNSAASTDQKKNWLALAEPLEAIRDKPEKVAENVTPIDNPVPKVSIELHWQYLGFAGTADRPAAFLALTPSAQRVVFLNEKIPDANDPDGKVYTIKSIDPQKVVVEHQGVEQTFEIVKHDITLGSSTSPILPTTAKGPRPPIMGGVPGMNSTKPNPTPMVPNGPVSPTTPPPGSPGVRAR